MSVVDHFYGRELRNNETEDVKSQNNLQTDLSRKGQTTETYNVMV